MQAYIIDPSAKTIGTFDYNGDWQTIAPAIGADLFDVVTTPEGYSLYVDDEGLYNSTDFFMYEGVPMPLAGKGLLFGPPTADGETTGIDVPMVDVAEKITYLNLFQVRHMAQEGLFDG